MMFGQILKWLIFPGKYFDIEPFLSSDGLKLFFASNRPLASTDEKTKDFDIWYVERENKNAEWSRSNKYW